jgi:hypothetical protein
VVLELENLFVTCALMGIQTMMANRYDAIVRAEAQMPDSSTSRALQNMQQSKVSGGMVVI